MFNFIREIINDDPTLLAESIQRKAALIDVRTIGEYADENVEGSINIPLQQVPDKLDELLTKDEIIVFCRSGHRADQAKRFLLQNGCTRVLNGGSWQGVAKLVAENS